MDSMCHEEALFYFDDIARRADVMQGASKNSINFR